MFQRISGVCWGLAGLLAILALIIVRYDLDRAAQSGPRWRRRLVTAGLFVLAAIGLIARPDRVQAADAPKAEVRMFGARRASRIGNPAAAVAVLQMKTDRNR